MAKSRMALDVIAARIATPSNEDQMRTQKTSRVVWTEFKYTKPLSKFVKRCFWLDLNSQTGS